METAKASMLSATARIMTPVMGVFFSPVQGRYIGAEGSSRWVNISSGCIDDDADFKEASNISGLFVTRIHDSPT